MDETPARILGESSEPPPLEPVWPTAPLLMLVSDRKRYGDRTLEEVFLAGVSAGVNLILLWESDLPARGLLAEAQRLRKIALGGVLLFVHDRVDVAVAALADGVHLDQEGLPLPAVVSASGNLLVGRSVTSVAEAVAAELDGARFLIAGPIFFHRYGDGRSPFGPSLIRRIKARVRVPLLASGGITAGNAYQVIASGADGVAVTTEILEAEDVRAAARSLMDAMREAWPTRPLHRT